MSKTIAVIGASSDRKKFGNKCVRAYTHAGWQVFPVNPSETEIEGLQAYPSIQDVPGDLDRISVYLAPPVGRRVLPAIAEKPADEVWFNPGAADAALLQEAAELGIRAISGCSIVDVGLSPSQFPG
jgi:predicted CoA-binding protein